MAIDTGPTGLETAVPDDPPVEGRVSRGQVGGQSTGVLRFARPVVLALGALLFLFPFYYMIIGSFQEKPDTSLGGAFPDLGNLTTANYTAINSAISLGRSLFNSGVFTGGVILGTVTIGMLAGYALAQLEFRGRGVMFALLLLVQIVPFQLLMIPLYVQLIRGYGLGDSYLGMILPFLVNATAVFIFRQFFVSLPKELFDAARLDGTSEFQLLRYVALPLVRPALLTVVLVTFIGPWNEFLRPFLVTKDQAMQPLAVSLANFISSQAGREANPFGAILAGAVVLALPAAILFIVFQRHFTATDISSGVKG